MTKHEKELLKSRFQQRWGQAICVQQWAKEGKNGWTKEDAEEVANIACGYVYAIGDVLEATMKQSKATDIVRGWADEVEKNWGHRWNYKECIAWIETKKSHAGTWL